MWWFQHSWWACFSSQSPSSFSQISAVLPFGAHKSCTLPLRGVSHCSRLAYNFCPLANLSDLSPLEMEKAVGSYSLSFESLGNEERVGDSAYPCDPAVNSCLRYGKGPLAFRNVQIMRSRYHSHGPAHMQISKVLCSGLYPSWLIHLDVGSVQAPNSDFSEFCLLLYISLSTISCLYHLWHDWGWDRNRSSILRQSLH